MNSQVKELAELHLKARYNPGTTQDDYKAMHWAREAVFSSADEGELGEVVKRPLTDEAIRDMLKGLSKKAGAEGKSDEAIAYGLAAENIDWYIMNGDELTPEDYEEAI